MIKIVNDENYINIPISRHHEYIYRIIPLYRLYELFENEKSFLVKPEKWDDPFENFIHKSPKVFGQCWSREMASDAMWRIYDTYPKCSECYKGYKCSNCSKRPECCKSPEELIPIRIRSTVKKLVESFAKSNKEDTKCFIGRVKYLNKEKIRDAFHKNKQPTIENLSAKSLAETLLIKRRAFKHEAEVRLIFIANNAINSAEEKKGLFSYTVEPSQLIDQIMIDPLSKIKPERKVNDLKQTIAQRTGFEKKRIKYSFLYDFPSKF